MLVFGDLVWIPFTFSIQGWWLLMNSVESTPAAIVANCFVFLIGYMVFRGANKQNHVFKKNPKARIWGKPPKVIGGKLLASGYWGIARRCNYLGDLMLALSFSLPCGISLSSYSVNLEREGMKLVVQRSIERYGPSIGNLFHGEYCLMFIKKEKKKGLHHESFILPMVLSTLV
ncbi:hypothetical protein JHK84_027352 [Glycine max]|nr:hypothetical protein JHK84_027352 [Glycine max]